MTQSRDKDPDPVDIHVGSQLRLRRLMCGVTQEALGAYIGVTFQQVQKYENGTNRISASRLYRISELLRTPVSFFFDGCQGTEASLPGLDIQHLPLESIRHALEFARVEDSEGREAIRSLTRWLLRKQ